MSIIGPPSAPGLIWADIEVDEQVTELTYHGNSIGGYFNCANTKIQTLHGSPIAVKGYFNCSGTDIKSLYGCPRDIGGHFFCGRTVNLISLQDVHKMIDRIGGVFYIPSSIRSRILGLLKIRELQSVDAVFPVMVTLTSAITIINKYLKDKPSPQHRNIHKCQEELIEAGLEDFAQL